MGFVYFLLLLVGGGGGGVCLFVCFLFCLFVLWGFCRDCFSIFFCFFLLIFKS